MHDKQFGSAENYGFADDDPSDYAAMENALTGKKVICKENPEPGKLVFEKIGKEIQDTIFPQPKITPS